MADSNKLEAVAWMYDRDGVREWYDDRLTSLAPVGWTETPLTDLNKANEIIAEKEAEIARLREALSQADDRLTECHGYIYQNWARPSSGALQDVIYETRAALKEE